MHDHSDTALSVVALLTEYSAPLEWEYNGLSVFFDISFNFSLIPLYMFQNSRRVSCMAIAHELARL